MTDHFALPERLDLSTAGSVADALRSRIGAPLVLDAGPVRHVGALGAQILMSATATWSATGHSLSLSQPSDEFTAQMAELGLAVQDLIVEGVADGA